jgi:hypothetical protein
MQGAIPHFFRHVPARVVIGLFALLALVPVAFIALSVLAATRNVVYWDEFDTVLDLLLTLDSGVDFRGFLERIFAINNEHRMITSRLLFAASWWLTGTVDFRIIGAIGNLFLVILCVTLLVSVHTTSRRLRLGIILACLMFSFEHFENLFWSGASIDHFQVVALAVGAFALIARGTHGALIAAGFLAVLATFTLAHGMITWAVGAFMLWRAQRRIAFWSWMGAAALICVVFFQGFQINSGHPIAGADLEGVLHVFRYWLALLGAPLALGYIPAAPYAGVLLLAGFSLLIIRDAWRWERVMLPVFLFCIAALGMIAIGRSEVAGGQLQSRYMVLSALAWATVIFTTMEGVAESRRMMRFMTVAVPLLAIFNVIANVRFARSVEDFIEGRDDATLRLKQRGDIVGSHFRLYPIPERAHQLLKAAAQRGLYWMPPLCTPAEIENAKPSDRITYHVDEMTVGNDATYVAGWAAISDRKSRRGEIHLVLRSPTSNLIYTTVAKSRPDVAAAHAAPEWRLSGFRFAVARSRLPAEELQVGIMIKDGDDAEYIMTGHRLRLTGRGEALLANSQ